MYDARAALAGGRGSAGASGAGSGGAGAGGAAGILGEEANGSTRVTWCFNVEQLACIKQALKVKEPTVTKRQKLSDMGSFPY